MGAFTYHFQQDDLLRVRFALHPLGELIWAAEALMDPSSKSVHLPWIRRARERVDGLDWSLLAALCTSFDGPMPYGVDFVVPPPTTPLPDVVVELERVRRTDPAIVAREVGLRFPDGVPDLVRPLLDDPERGLEALVAQMTAFWDRALAADWPAIRALAEADIAHRTRHLAQRGAEAVFADLHEEVAWHDGALQVRRVRGIDVELDGRGLLLVPMAFAWPTTAVLHDPPWQPTLIYPALGVGDLWAPAAAARDGGPLAELLGALEHPASTHDLAHRLELPSSSVSEHLGVLRRSGLVHGWREGRHVRYARTDAGDRLIASPPA
jgi:DNA-binding transcriptional ArsR family regulator